MRIKLHLWAAGIVLLSTFVFIRPAHATAANCHVVDEKQINGAYRFPDGKLVSILSSGPDGHRRIIHFDSGKAIGSFPPVNSLSNRRAGWIPGIAIRVSLSI